MGGADEEWVKAAMTDDMMVVELLLRLHRAPRRQPPLKPVPAALPLEWSVRQRRSKSVSVNNHPKKPAHRASPTTPLSWSGATSFSGGSAGAGGVGSEESSRPIPLKLSNTARSKNLDIYCHARGKESDSAIGSGLACVNADNDKTTSKRSKKKKTLVELKDEESWLLKERIDLKRRMAVLRLNLERQRATNENLKRMKLWYAVAWYFRTLDVHALAREFVDYALRALIELQPHLNRESTSAAEESTSGQPQQDLTTVVMPPVASINDGSLQPSTSNARPDENAEAASDSKFFLPDLNIPFDEPSPDVVCGVS
ncbi:UNVERIFIED_CONTAM: hypothetical protein Scaly_1877900 [Sesamum calycinum]|uniref:Uncharacterized protein n=1 Tax=Sesamum calycinum TaxID=2727403 RepID=A0AAW2NG54_9LAMI